MYYSSGVEIYGGSINGFAIAGGDVDASLVVPDLVATRATPAAERDEKKAARLTLLRRIAKDLKEYPQLYDRVELINAKVPLVKCVMFMNLPNEKL